VLGIERCAAVARQIRFIEAQRALSRLACARVKSAVAPGSNDVEILQKRFELVVWHRGERIVRQRGHRCLDKLDPLDPATASIEGFDDVMFVQWCLYKASKSIGRAKGNP
jgi:hypothetical protein